MPKRRPVISDEIILREVGHLSDEVQLLPSQVGMLTGLSVGQLKERLRTKPPQPPRPEPREKPRDAIWYSLGEIRRFKALRADKAAMTAELARRGFGFAAWMNAPTGQEDPAWPFALTGPHQRPVDAWAAIRGEVLMSRSDRVVWLTIDDYLRARLAAAHAEQGERDHLAAVAKATTREERSRSHAVGLPERSRPKPRT